MASGAGMQQASARGQRRGGLRLWLAVVGFWASGFLGVWFLTGEVQAKSELPRGRQHPTMPLVQATPPGPPQTPATYYGGIQAGGGFTPTATLTVTARINATLCGQGHTLEDAGQVVYVIQVSADGGGTEGCGATGRFVTFMVGATHMETIVAWSNAEPTNLVLRPACPDFRQDGWVTVADVQVAAGAWGSPTHDSPDVRYDRDRDGDIDTSDVAAVASGWGEGC